MFRYSEHLSNLPKAIGGVFVKLTNFPNLVSGKLCFWAFGASKSIYGCAAFIDHVLNVFFLSAKKQMFGVYTASIVALVKHVHTLRDFAKMKFPRVSVCGSRYGFIVLVGSEVSVPTLPFNTSPVPASVGSLNLAKESLRKTIAFNVCHVAPYLCVNKLRVA